MFDYDSSDLLVFFFLWFSCDVWDYIRLWSCNFFIHKLFATPTKQLQSSTERSWSSRKLISFPNPAGQDRAILDSFGKPVAEAPNFGLGRRLFPHRLKFTKGSYRDERQTSASNLAFCSKLGGTGEFLGGGWGVERRGPTQGAISESSSKRCRLRRIFGKLHKKRFCSADSSELKFITTKQHHIICNKKLEHCPFQWSNAVKLKKMSGVPLCMYDWETAH